MEQEYRSMTPIEESLEKSLYLLDGKLGSRKTWNQGLADADIDDILEKKNPSELFKDHPELTVENNMGLDPELSDIISSIGSTYDQERAQDDWSYLYIRRGIVGRFTIEYEVDAGEEANLDEQRIDEIIKDKNNYKENILIDLNIEGHELEDLYNGHSCSGGYLVYVSIDKDGSVFSDYNDILDVADEEIEWEAEGSMMLPEIKKLVAGLDGTKVSDKEVMKRLNEFLINNK